MDAFYIAALENLERQENAVNYRKLSHNVINILTPHMTEATRTSALNIQTKVFIALNFFATGSYQLPFGNSNLAIVSQPTVSRAIYEVVNALNQPEIFKYWWELKIVHILEYFLPKPMILFILNTEYIYANRKNYHSLNVQLVCDSDMKIINVSALFPGSVNDAYIWNNSLLEPTLRRIYNYNPEEFYLLDELDNGYPPIGGGPSVALQGENRNSVIYRDAVGYEYHMNWEVRDTRYLRCARRYAGCRVTAHMGLEPGAPISLGNRQQFHHPRSLDVRLFLNVLRERGGRENATPAQIYNEVAPQNVRAAVVVGRPAAIRTIARARGRLSPPIPESLQEWADIINLRTICIDGTYQVRPNHPADIAQLITVQVRLNNVAIPIVHGLLVDSTTESYCRLLQFIRNDLQLNFEYQNLRVITDFEQGLRNAVMMVMPESMNTGCWFHYIRSIIRFVRSNHLARLCNTNANARRIVRMLMALPHLPSDMVEYYGNQFSISLGFLNIQNLVNQYNLNNELNVLIIYFQHYWMDIVGPPRFSVYRLRHRTNNFIESYHASLLRRMGQHPPL
ncbi:unnamed protein product [Macrosiphum euphorbiae]|uniref:Transposase n=1 Tax=Macrosiphum euphorbiae TaxID=13131 RepID=A0AAV0WIN8_9HEMI|nr:unnamed protein product [Macrosiphum euphorbiae]